MTLPNTKEIDSYIKLQEEQLDRMVMKIDNLMEYCFKFSFTDFHYRREDINSFIKQVSTLLNLPYEDDTHLRTWRSKSAIWPRKTFDDFEIEINCLWDQLPDDAKQF